MTALIADVPDSSTERSARILATGSKLMCSAVVVHVDGTIFYDLPVVKKTSQKGD